MTPEEITAAACALARAERERRQIGLLSLQHPGMTLDEAYEVQKEFVALRLAEGRRVIGHKIGLTSRAMQEALGITTPDSGTLLDDMEFASGAIIPQGRFIQPRIEAELAFILHTPLQGPEVTAEEVLAATAQVLPALEILDTRILRRDPATGQARTIVDTVADNAANAGIVTGAPRAPDFDHRWAGAIVQRNGVVEETGLGAGVLNQPALSVAWLANRLAMYGQRIEAGQIVLSGSFIRPIECRPGDHIHADFGPLGVVTCHFA